MSPTLFAALTVTKPVAVGIGIAALVVLFLAFKVGRFMVKLLLMLSSLVAILMAAWWYYSAHHG